jgi:hypothetical protein
MENENENTAQQNENEARSQLSTFEKELEDELSGYQTLEEIQFNLILETEEETIDVMYNSTYGDFSYSDLAKTLYQNRTNRRRYQEPSRCDELMVKIVKELGAKANGKHCRIKFETIPEKYREYYHISEYDGLETVHVDCRKYEAYTIMDNIKAILTSIMDDNEKIIELNKIVFVHPI